MAEDENSSNNKKQHLINFLIYVEMPYVRYILSVSIFFKEIDAHFMQRNRDLILTLGLSDLMREKNYEINLQIF